MLLRCSLYCYRLQWDMEKLQGVCDRKHSTVLVSIVNRIKNDQNIMHNLEKVAVRDTIRSIKIVHMH